MLAEKKHNFVLLYVLYKIPDSPKTESRGPKTPQKKKKKKKKPL
jgi:hypothetical protein